MTTPNIPMATLLERMSSQKSGDILPFSDAQVQAMVEVVMPGVLKAPGMPEMKCTMDRDDKGWTLHVERA